LFHAIVDPFPRIYSSPMWYNSPKLCEPYGTAHGGNHAPSTPVAGGESRGRNQLFTLVLPNLRRLAHYLMQRERKDHSLQATELVDQIYFAWSRPRSGDWQNRNAFFRYSG